MQKLTQYRQNLQRVSPAFSYPFIHPIGEKKPSKSQTILNTTECLDILSDV